MSQSSTPGPMLSRRDFVTSAAAAATAAVLPQTAARAATPARYRRMNASAPGFPSRILDSYRKAIRAMLKLPPSDPRNWYRNALVHTIDCPHGNWWFMPWHRGYVGWFERTCRELSGDPDFAFPYWDWTIEPRVPVAMFEDVLTPTAPEYIASFEEFKDKFQGVVKSYWDALSDDQVNQLLVRGLRFPEDLWFDIGYPRSPFFFPRAKARYLSREKPDLDGKTARSVLLSTILDALAPRDFIGFGSPKTMQHSGLTGFGVLEGQPHNRVHNCVGGIFTDPSGHTIDAGGFMQGNLSPVDPLFFLHHSNIDRLWDVWTRKQQARGYPTVPTEGDHALWANEPFLFFVDDQGKPLGPKTAGDFATIGDFAYDYQPGSGEEVVQPPALAAARSAKPERFAARLAAPAAGAAGAAGGSVALPAALLGGPNAPRLTARITVALPPLSHAGDYIVVADAPQGSAATNPSNPHFVASLAMFGHHIMHGPVTFAVPLSQTVAALSTQNLLKAQAPLTLRVVSEAPPPTAAAHAHAAAAAPEVLSIVVEAD